MKRYPDPDIRMLIYNLRIILAELENRYDVPQNDPLGGGWDFFTPPQSPDEVHFHHDPFYPKRRKQPLFDAFDRSTPASQQFVQQRRQRRKR